jgi:hypothetical protein
VWKLQRSAAKYLRFLSVIIDAHDAATTELISENMIVKKVLIPSVTAKKWLPMVWLPSHAPLSFLVPIWALREVVLVADLVERYRRHRGDERRRGVVSLVALTFAFRRL